MNPFPTMDIFTLGTGGMMPMPERFLSSFVVRRDNDPGLLMFDCGEGTQIQLKRLGLGWGGLDRIFISHTHADHVTGLPGLMMLISQNDRTAPLDIYGPPRIRDYVDSIAVLEPVITCDVRVHEIDAGGVVLEGDEYDVECRWLEHTRPCVGYRLEEHPRPGRFDPAKAEELGVPNGPIRARLVQGESVELPNGQTVESDAVVGPPRPGLAVAYITDTRPCAAAVELARDADLLICEAMYADEHADEAKAKMHMTAREAAELAAEAGAKRLALTHISPRYLGGSWRTLRDEAQSVFPDARLLEDLQTIDLPLP